MKNFPDGLEKRLTLPNFPRSEDEMSFIRDKIATRTAEDVASIRNHDQEPFYAIRQYCEKNNLPMDRDKFMKLMDNAGDIIGKFKKSFNRIRPFELDKKLNTLPSKTNKTRAYPSGHACQATVVARYVAGKVPRLERELMAAARECGYGRVLAGFHYVSDYEIGNLLGEKLYVFMNKADYGQETRDE